MRASRSSTPNRVSYLVPRVRALRRFHCDAEPPVYPRLVNSASRQGKGKGLLSDDARPRLPPRLPFSLAANAPRAVEQLPLGLVHSTLHAHRRNLLYGQLRSFSSVTENSDAATEDDVTPTTGIKTTKHWCSNGAMTPEMAKVRYYLPPTAWNKKYLLRRVASMEQDERYVILHGPSQSGKTTRIKDLIVLLKSAAYVPVYVDLGMEGVDQAGFWRLLNGKIAEKFADHHAFHSADTFQEWAMIVGPKLVLIFDEADALTRYEDPKICTSFLNALRSLKHQERGPAAVFLVGRFLATHVASLTGSPFNTVSEVFAPQFTEAETVELFEQYEKDVQQSVPSFKVDREIVGHIYRLTNGHPGLTTLCGRMLHEQVCTFGRAPTPEEWSLNHSLSPVLTKFMATPNGRRMTDSLRYNPECAQFAARVLRLHKEVVTALDSGAVNKLAQEGIVTLAHETEVVGEVTRPCTTASFFCPIVMAIVRRHLAQRMKPAELKSLDVPHLVEVALPRFAADLINDPASKKANNVASREAVYAYEFFGVLQSIFKFYNLKMGVSFSVPREDDADRKRETGVNTDRVTDLVASRYTSEGTPERLFILELCVNSSVTWSPFAPNERPPADYHVTPPSGDLRKRIDSNRKSLFYHITKAAEYARALPPTKEGKPHETWVLHFTTTPPPNNAATYPNPCPGDVVKVMHVLHDASFTKAVLYLPDSPPKAISLYPPLEEVQLGFNLESFLRDEAMIDEDGAQAYLPLLRKNKVTEAKLHLLTDAMLLKWGIEADLDRAAILHAAQKRSAGRQGAGRV